MANQLTSSNDNRELGKRPDQYEAAEKTPTTDLRKLNRKFVASLLRDFNRNGGDALEAFREKYPDRYCQLVASFVPREQTLNVNSKSEVTHTHNHNVQHTASLLQRIAHSAIEQDVIDVEPSDAVSKSDDEGDPY